MEGNPETFHLVIASVGEKYFDGAAVSASIPTVDEEITILPHHEAIIATLKKGIVTVRKTLGEDEVFTIDGGILECSDNRVTMLL